MIARMLGLGPKKPSYLAIAEYWVYLPDQKLPPQDVVLARMIRNNPFQQGEEPPITPREGLFFSDIRLDTALVLREKNPHLFRPDLFEEHIEPTAEALEALSEASAFAKLRYASDEPLRDDRHLQFLPYYAEALAYYARASIAFDSVGERLLEMENLRERLRANPEAALPDLHLRTVWQQTARGGAAATRGLMKIGLPEIETPESPSEHRTVICGVLEEAALKLWEAKELSEEVTVPYFEDEFHVRLTPRRREPAIARIHRVQQA